MNKVSITAYSKTRIPKEHLTLAVWGGYFFFPVLCIRLLVLKSQQDSFKNGA